MFKYLEKCNYSNILVTAPQRAGTRITAKILAHDLNYVYVDEKKFNADSIRMFSKCLKNRKQVLHCPAMLYKIQDFATEDNLVVVVLRNINDIKKSLNRIGWRCEERELLKYGHRLEDNVTSTEIKYDFWNSNQKSIIPNWLEIEYNSLSEHKLFIPKEKRKDFKWDQTE